LAKVINVTNGFIAADHQLCKTNNTQQQQQKEHSVVPGFLSMIDPLIMFQANSREFSSMSCENANKDQFLLLPQAVLRQ